MNARLQRDGNSKSSVVAETMKLLAHSSYGYEITDRNQHTVTKFLGDDKTHSARNSRNLKRPKHITYRLYQVELVELEIEPINSDTFWIIFVYNMLNRGFGKSFTICLKMFRDADRYEKLEMDTNSLHLALSEENMENVVLSKKRNQWNAMRLRDGTEFFTANAMDRFFPRLCFNTQKNIKNGNQGSSRKKADVQKCCVYRGKPIVAMNE